MASGKKLVSPSLNMFSNVTKAFGHTSKAYCCSVMHLKPLVMGPRAFSDASKVFSEGMLFSKWHVYNISSLPTLFGYCVSCTVWYYYGKWYNEPK